MTQRRYGNGDGGCRYLSVDVCFCRIMSFNVCIYKKIEVLLFDKQTDFYYLYTII